MGNPRGVVSWSGTKWEIPGCSYWNEVGDPRGVVSWNELGDPRGVVSWSGMRWENRIFHYGGTKLHIVSCDPDRNMVTVNLGLSFCGNSLFFQYIY